MFECYYIIHIVVGLVKSVYMHVWIKEEMSATAPSSLSVVAKIYFDFGCSLWHAPWSLLLPMRMFKEEVFQKNIIAVTFKGHIYFFPETLDIWNRFGIFASLLFCHCSYSTFHSDPENSICLWTGAKLNLFLVAFKHFSIISCRFLSAWTIHFLLWT